MIRREVYASGSCLNSRFCRDLLILITFIFIQTRKKYQSVANRIIHNTHIRGVDRGPAPPSPNFHRPLSPSSLFGSAHKIFVFSLPILKKYFAFPFPPPLPTSPHLPLICPSSYPVLPLISRSRPEFVSSNTSLRSLLG